LAVSAIVEAAHTTQRQERESKMATEVWLEAARNYNRMDDRARAEYWKQLTPEQQDALRDALATFQPAAVAGPAGIEPASAPARRGCASPLAAGCIGMILGCVITIGVEIAAVMMGVQAVGNAVGSLGGGGAGVSSAPTTHETPPAGCEDPAYAEANLYKCNPDEYYRQWKRNREMNEKDGQP